MQGTHTITSKKTTPKWTKDVNRRFSREDKRRPNSRISRQGNACHDQWVVSSPLGMAVINKPQDNKCQRGRGERRTLGSCCWECKSVPSLWKTAWSFLKRFKLELPCDSAVPLWVHFQIVKLLSWRDTCVRMFIAAVVTVASWVSIERWVDKGSPVCVHARLQWGIVHPPEQEFCHLHQHSSRKPSLPAVLLARHDRRSRGEDSRDVAACGRRSQDAGPTRLSRGCPRAPPGRPGPRRPLTCFLLP